jgi:branched-subunit amino acid transport protein
MIWYGIIISGILNFLTKFLSLSYFDTSKMSPKVKQILSYVPSAVFPAIIFPAIFINDFGSFVETNDPKIFGAIVAVIVGYFSKNIIATILSGLISYWFLIFVIFN